MARLNIKSYMLFPGSYKKRPYTCYHFVKRLSIILWRASQPYNNYFLSLLYHGQSDLNATRLWLTCAVSCTPILSVETDRTLSNCSMEISFQLQGPILMMWDTIV